MYLVSPSHGVPGLTELLPHRGAPTRGTNREKRESDVVPHFKQMSMTLWNTYLVDSNMNLLEQRKKFGFDVFPSPRDISYNCIYADYARCPAERSNSDGSEQTMRRGVPFFSLSLATQTSTANVSAVFSGSPLAVETLTQERRSNERTSLRRSNGAECFPLQTQPRPARLGMRLRESRGSYKRLPTKFERDFSCSCMTLHFTVLNHLII